MKSSLLSGTKLAALVLVIVSGLFMSSARAQGPFKDFDVVASSLDANRFPLNPLWGQQARDNTLPSPKSSCPVDDQDTSKWTSSPQYPNCTSIPVTFNSGWICGHHANFLPVAYEGSVAWASGPNWFDHDYSFDVTRPQDSALYSTVASDVHSEFDATETVDNWDGTNTWWDTFHHQAVDQSDSKASAMINGRTAIIIGLLGMDTQHAAKTELHPIYAMFVQLGNSIRITPRRQTSWAFFARNWGNEGYCGDSQENMYTQTLKVQIDNAGPIQSSNIWGGARNTNDLSGLSMSAQPKTGAIVLTLNLLPPDKQSWIEGDITFQAPQQVFLPGVLTTGGGSVHPRPENEAMGLASSRALGEQLDRLPETTKRELLAQQQAVVPAKKGKRLQLINVASPTQLGNISLSSARAFVRTPAVIRRIADPVARLQRQKQLEVLRAFLAKNKIKP